MLIINVAQAMANNYGITQEYQTHIPNKQQHNKDR
jgi:hypothetical protein